MFNIPDSLPPITITLTDFVAIDTMLASYHPKGEEQQKIVKYLERELNRAEVVAAKDLPEGMVSMHSVIRYSDSKSEAARTVTLVFPHEADIDAGKISLMTPIGAALIGMAVGNSITWYTPAGGEQTLTVLEVKQAAVG